MNPIWNNKILYLTFDDGPTPRVTPWVLSLLQKYSFKATFFCLGKNAEQHPELINDILNFGHQVGNHGYEHLNGWKTTSKKYIENVDKSANILKTKLFRPPYGKITPIQWYKLRRQHRIVWWNYLSKDYLKESINEKNYLNLLKNTKSKRIIVFHDTEKAMPFLEKYLELYFQWIKQEGFQTFLV